MLKTGGAETWGPRLNEVLSLVQLPAALADTAAAKAVVATDAGGRPPSPQAETTLAGCNMVVPYLEDGTIDWVVLEDEYFPMLEEDRQFFCEVRKLDSSEPQSSNLHPYDHRPREFDCCIIGHTYNCEQCRETMDVSSPARKMSNAAAAE